MRKIILFLLALPFAASAQCWQKVDAGDGFTVARATDGTLWSWGENTGGQLGDGTNMDRNYPHRINEDTDWQSFSAGGGHVMAIKADGTLWGWGSNVHGEIGAGTAFVINTPQQLSTETWQSVSCGFGHTLAIKTDGTLWAWGYNLDGELGNGTNISPQFTPVQIGSQSGWQKVACGYYHTIAIKMEGTLWAWGRNVEGQLGTGNNNDSNIPIQIGTGNGWQDVAAGGAHSMALKSDGTVWTFGYNFNGELGDSSTVYSRNYPVQTGAANNWTAISAGHYHSMALKSDGTLWAWGDNDLYYVLGGTYPDQHTPRQVGTDSNWQAISAGGRHTTAIRENNTLWECGYNSNGQLGNGSNTGDHPGTNSQASLAMVSCDALGVSGVVAETNFSVSPVPSHDRLNIQKEKQLTIDKIIIADVTGKVIFMKHGNPDHIDIGGFENGIYIIAIYSGKEIYKQKFVKH